MYIYLCCSGSHVYTVIKVRLGYVACEDERAWSTRDISTYNTFMNFIHLYEYDSMSLCI